MLTDEQRQVWNEQMALFAYDVHVMTGTVEGPRKSDELLLAVARHLEETERERDAAHEQVAALRQALRWYGRESNYAPQSRYIGGGHSGSQVETDGGQRARAALTADATQAGERWRGMREVCDLAAAVRQASRSYETAQPPESHALSRYLADKEPELDAALDALAALGEEAGE